MTEALKCQVFKVGRTVGFEVTVHPRKNPYIYCGKRRFAMHISITLTNTELVNELSQ